MEKFDQILEMSNNLDMMYLSRDKREQPPEQADTWRWEETPPLSVAGKGFTIGVAESNSEWN